HWHGWFLRLHVHDFGRRLADCFASRDRDRVRAETSRCQHRKRLADLVRRALDARYRDIHQPLVERTVIPEILFHAAETSVAGADWPGHAIVPLHRGASA